MTKQRLNLDRFVNAKDYAGKNFRFIRTNQPNRVLRQERQVKSNTILTSVGWGEAHLLSG